VYTAVTVLILVYLDGCYPDTAKECFDMFKENRFTALLKLDIVSVVVIPFYYIMFYCLCQSLKTNYKLVANIALFDTLTGKTIFISGVNIVSIVLVSDKFHAATSPEVKQQLFAACEGMLASDMWINN